MKKTKKIHVVNTSENRVENQVFYYQVKDTITTIFNSNNKLRSNSIFKTFLLPFFYFGWILSCFLVSSRIIEKEKIDYIFVSYRPPQVILIGFLLKIKHRKCKLITEYRDSWTDNPYTRFPSKVMKKIAEIIEYHIINESDLIIVVSVVEKNRFLKKYTHITDKIVIIRNGFYDYNVEYKKKDQFTITHSGSFYGSRQPDFFLKGYKKFLEERKVPDSKLVFVGRLDKENIEKISKLGLGKHVEMLGNLTYTDSLTIIHNSSILLFIEYTDSMTTKIYDYISSGNPIIALTKNIELIKFIKKYSPKSEIIIDNNKEKIAQSLNILFEDWKKSTRQRFENKEEFYRKYSRKNLAKKLLQYI